MTDQRGGIVIKTGKIGRCNVLRQQLVAPGEMINTHIQGNVTLENLREKETLRIHGHLATFLTPVRWLDSNWTTFLSAGPNGGETITTTTGQHLNSIGLGASNSTAVTYPKFFLDAVLRIFNEWYKWPEDADATTWGINGEKAVPLQRAWNRARYTATPTQSNDYTVSSASNFDVRTLAETQAKFRAAMERDVLSYGRYMELVQEMYNANGSREVDKVPMKIDEQTLSVRPRNQAATDAAGLGEWSSNYEYQIDHHINGITAPEHCVLTYVLLNRFAPVIESRNPLAVGHYTYEEIVGDPEILRNQQPQEVTIRDVATSTSTTSLGYLPAGWQWRMGWDVIGKKIDNANSFPMMEIPTGQANAKDATRVKEAFRSNALGDYLADLEFSEKSKNLHGSALESYFSGMTGASSNAELPKQGKML